MVHGNFRTVGKHAILKSEEILRARGVITCSQSKADGKVQGKSITAPPLFPLVVPSDRSV